jgi:aminodeoxyfutalosine deaminase
VTQLLLAHWIFPVSEPLVSAGGLVIDDGRIVGIGKAAELTAKYPAAPTTNFGDALILPGLVNPHTHLELSDLSPPLRRPADFVPWLTQAIPRANNPTGSPAEATLLGIRQCLRFGVTCVGDITAFPRLTRPMLAQSPLHVVSFGEIRAMGLRRGNLDAQIASAADQACASAHLRVGLSPHAPYSVEVDGYAACVRRARQDNLPLATHLAESPDEEAFLRNHEGQFRRLWQSLPWHDELIPRFAGSPIQMAREVGLLDYPSVLAHVNYCSDADLDLLAAGRASVVYCPRTHACFGHRPHRFAEMLARGINVALGTDSCASSPDLDLMAEARLVHKLRPNLPPETLLRMITLNGALALGLERRIGSLEAGKIADLVVFPIGGDAPLAELLERAERPSHVFVGGIIPTQCQP